MADQTPKAAEIATALTLDSAEVTVISELLVEQPGTLIIYCDITWNDPTYVDFYIYGKTSESDVDDEFRARLSPFSDGTTENQQNMKIPYYRVTKAATGGGSTSAFEFVISLTGSQKLKLTAKPSTTGGTDAVIDEIGYYTGKGV